MSMFRSVVSRLSIAAMVMVLAGDGLAQKQDPRARGGAAQRGERGDGYGGADKARIKEKMARSKGEEGPKNMKPYVVISTGFKPRRIAPGENAELKVVVSIRKSVVIAAPDAIQLTYPETQGSFRFGAWTVSDPAPSTIYDAFSQQPVYDDTFTLTVPVSVDAEAPLRTHSVNMLLSATLTHGESSKTLGPHRTSVRGRVEIGEPLPKPRILRAAGGGSENRSGDTPTNLQPSLTPSADEPRASQEDRGVDAAEAARLDGDEATLPLGATSSAAGIPSPPPSNSFMLLGGGALLLLILAGLVISRRR